MPKSQGTLDQVYQLPNCSICLMALSKNISSIECGHVFHHQCISKVFERRPKCPNCQTLFKTNNIKKLIFESVAHQESWLNQSQIEECKAEYLKLLFQNKSLIRKLSIKDMMNDKQKQELSKAKSLQEQNKALYSILDMMGTESLNQNQKIRQLMSQNKQLQNQLISEKKKKEISEGNCFNDLIDYKKELQQKGLSDTQKANQFYELLKIKTVIQSKQKEKQKMLENLVCELQNQLLSCKKKYFQDKPANIKKSNTNRS